jgi:hypothetical protein
LLFQFDFFWNKWIFQFLEFVNVNGAFGKAVVKPVNLRFERSKFGFEPVDFLLFLVGHIRLPSFDPCKELFLPFVGNGDELRVAFNFPRELFFADETAVFALLRPALACATIVNGVLSVASR